jgi:putative effector of murein hydrolase LrgA (UPF0299 family)
MKKSLVAYLPIIFFVGAGVGLIWTIKARGADGSWLAVVVPLAIGLAIGITSKRHTGEFFSDKSGGH